MSTWQWVVLIVIFAAVMGGLQQRVDELEDENEDLKD